MTLRGTARDLFLQTLDHLGIAEVMQTRVSCRGETLRIGDLTYSLRDFERIVVIAVGKAAAPMWDALLPTLESGLQQRQNLQAIVVGASQPGGEDSRVQFYPGSHPFPNQTSLDAADAILKLLSSCHDRCLVLFLISGGASAMIEKALNSSLTVADTDRFYRALVQSGLPITQMNALRKHLSQVKGGRLAVAAQGATQCTLLISDVPSDALHIVGSGPSLPDPSTVEECRRIIDANRNALNFSDNLLAFFADPALAETAGADHPAFLHSAWISLLSSDDLCRVAGELAVKLGFHVVIDNSCDDWDYREAAQYLLHRLRELQQHHPRVCLLSAGEVSVQIPAIHGTGGRNQHFVLECSRLIAERKLKATVLSGGSDGVDGNSPAAGAVCDETTMLRASSKKLNIEDALERFDSFPLLSALEDVLVTGPTGNNVRDLRIVLSDS